MTETHVISFVDPDALEWLVYHDGSTNERVEAISRHRGLMRAQAAVGLLRLAAEQVSYGEERPGSPELIHSLMRRANEVCVDIDAFLEANGALPE